MEYKFPDGFFWGSATSAYQVEGGIENNDWAEAARQGKIPAAGKATDHYNRYEEDFDIVKKLNQNAHRFSIEWARIEPEEGKFNEKEIEHYRKVISALRERGIEPFVTLWHFTTPMWFVKKGGFLDEESFQYFLEYVRYVVKNLGDKVKFWITFNEATDKYVWEAYINGVWPPALKNKFFKAQKFICNLIKLHKLAYKEIKKINPNASIGIVGSNRYFDGQLMIKKIADYFTNNKIFLKTESYLDFIGINYYRLIRLLGSNIKEQEKSDVGWEIFPEGLYKRLLYLKKFKKPIFITENGIADTNDWRREKFIKDHLYFIWRAIQEGVDVRGYIHWSLLDNFEWESGFSPRFGLVEIDYETMERKIRPSAHEYAKICKENKLEI